MKKCMNPVLSNLFEDKRVKVNLLSLVSEHASFKFGCVSVFRGGKRTLSADGR